MLSPWIIRTLILSPLLASLVPHNFRRYHNTHHYLPKNRHHTYLSWHFHSHSEIYCHATFHRSIYYDTHHHCHIALHDHVVDIVFVAKPPCLIFDCSMVLYYLFWMLMDLILHFYIIFGTNLLTQGPVQIVVFAYFSVSQKRNIKRTPNGMKPSGA